MIYAIQAEGTEYVKFGITNGESVKTRLCILQVGCPHKLVLLAAAPWFDSDEERIHHYLREHHIRGEWFTLCDKARLVIKTMQEDMRESFIAPFMAKSKHKRLGAVLDYSMQTVY